MYTVYCHTNKANGKKYVGITCRDVSRRWRHGQGYYQNEHFSRAIKKYGWDNFTHDVLFQGLTKEEACQKEKELIAQYKSNECEYGYNHSIGGEKPVFGAKFSEKTKAKMSKARLNRKLTPEHSKAISRGKKGKPNGLEGRIGKDCMKAGIVQMIDEKTDEVLKIFYGYAEMHRVTGYAETPVKECVAGIRRRAYGYKWRYLKRGKQNVTI